MVDEGYPVWLKEFTVIPNKELGIFTMGEMHQMNAVRYQLDDIPTFLRQYRKDKLKKLNGWKRYMENMDEDVDKAEEQIAGVELAEVDSISALIRARIEEMAEKAKLEEQAAEAAGEEEGEEGEGKKPGKPADADADEVK
eukprot:CAMPEP_0176443892 /NCGR_PEP_ID=MMETSP0127-20121128/22717_1 /TAXON_ID=938130 /ORGANISM="Platyophrya macrostoma, Strain WH" /LENGTH=139 /DNA_ID=CAMNT_0017829255 /DNA_START=172 /DNA_END=591 /DNA_ORIENTATION=+